MPTLYLLIGSNQELQTASGIINRAALLQQATDLIRERIGSVVRCSRIFETAPWGVFDEEPLPFLNMAVAVDTYLSAHECLTICQQIEYELGRRRSAQSGSHTRVYSSRPIDIDLIFYNDEVINTPELTIPHPRMHLRRFVLEPLCDIAPTFVHPVFNKPLSTLLSECTDSCSCSLFC